MKKKIFKVLDILLYVFIFVAGIFTIITISVKRDSNNAFTILGHQMLVVETASMEQNDLFDVSDYKIKSIKTNSLIIIETVPKDNPYNFYSSIEQYDVLTFKYEIANKQEIITHRVITKQEVEGGFIFELRGDNINEDGTTSIQTIDTRDTESFNYIIGKVKSVSYPLGLVVTALKSEIGIILIIIVPCVILIGFEIMKIINELNKDKKIKANKNELELANKNQELEELKKRLQELENKKGDE